MSYESISLVEMDDFLRQRRFKPVDLYFRRRPVKEWVYERRLPQNANHFVRVYTTIQRYGGKTDQSRDVGKDAIRVQVIYRDEKGETLVSMPKRVNRISTWRDNLDDRLKEVAESLPKVKMDSRGEPMTLRKKRGNLFWGSRDYPAFKETRRYGSEQAESEDGRKGVAVLIPDESTYGPQISGTVYFEETNEGVKIDYQIRGLYDGPHGFHIHEYGDLTDGCTSACAHFNPDGATHGGLDTKIRHFGDLGNIESKDRLAEGSLFLPNGRLDGSKYSILGRMIIVHADRDDLGEGGDEESLKTGNAGKRLACGVIGLADPKDAVDKKAETVRECCQCGKTEGITTIQAGTYCYECLPINLGAEEYLNPNDPEMINILLLEWAMKTNQTYDSLTIQKGLANYIDVSPYDFVRHMQNQDLISLKPAVNLGWNALVPADFLYYLQDKDRDHWINMKSRAVGIERYKYLKEKISEERYWLSDSKKDYHRWSFQSAINYQNI